MKIAVLITVFNRIDKTLLCLKTLFEADTQNQIDFKVFLTDDGSTDGTSQKIMTVFPMHNIEILEGNGQLFWNGGMINSWKAAIREGTYDGYLWLNNDSLVYPHLWKELLDADTYAKDKLGKGGIYVGSTYNKDKTGLSYGGFNFVNKWTLKDEFVIPNGSFQRCEAAHGNITYVSHNVVDKEGIFCDKYVHSGGDHDYTYLAFKHGFPVFILREYVGECENDHLDGGFTDFIKMSLRDRLKYLKSALGFNLQNTLLFNSRCFPFRYPFVWFTGYGKALFPKLFFYMYRKIRT
ncbi:glycosyltransferase [Sphingobacterium spiritivorum]|uniref:glycosyltransferase family 2 protein n=1 Tax=Sphingobacterium spiritivorum TaxID=258 RepID=UPI003DA5F1D3